MKLPRTINGIQMFACLTACCLASAFPGRAMGADDVIPPVDRRYSTETDEVPHFQRHVLPLLRTLGCSGRTCHGAASGQGEFRLSLFGYDFDHDYQMISDDDRPRIDLNHHEKSLLLQKPTMAIEHGGGERFKPDSWQYRVIFNWIRGGAIPVDSSDPQFVRLTVEPSQIIGAIGDRPHQLKVFCEWSDESREDVTPLSFMQILDESVAAVDDRGMLTLQKPGDTHLIVYYDNGVVSVPLIVPDPELAPVQTENIDQLSLIDRRIAEKLDTLRIVPSDICNDAEFLRRVSLDMTGWLPDPNDVREFLKDTDPDKRRRKIDELLESPGHASYWAFKLSEMWGNHARDYRDAVARDPQGYHWYKWLEDRLSRNIPYDEIVEGMVLSHSRFPDESYDDYVARVSQIYREQSDYQPVPNETMPNFWYRTNTKEPKDAARAFSHSFVGVQLECAECHKHPFDIWTNADFRHFASFFSRIRHIYTPEIQARMDAEPKDLNPPPFNELKARVRRGEPMPYREIVILPPVTTKEKDEPIPTRNLVKDLIRTKNAMRQARKDKNKAAFDRAEQQLLGINRARLQQLEQLIEKTEAAVKHDHPILVKYRENAAALRREIMGLQTTKILNGIDADPQAVEDPRSILMDWLRSPDNPYFARYFVNRLWAAYFSRGIIDPTDDLNLANPPVNRPLLDDLTREFIVRHYDIKWLHREIANSLAYQRSWKPNETNGGDEMNFSRAIPRRLPAEVIEMAVHKALGSEKASDYFQYQQTEYEGRLGRNHMLTIFGRPERTQFCDCREVTEPTIMQSVFVQNDDLMHRWLNESQWVHKTTNGQSPPSMETIIEEAYLRTLSRLPTYEELTDCRTYLAESESLATGLKDILWALLNTKEFQVNH